MVLGELAQLARALAWHARGHRFESGILHKIKKSLKGDFFIYHPIRYNTYHLITVNLNKSNINRQIINKFLSICQININLVRTRIKDFKVR